MIFIPISAPDIRVASITVVPLPRPEELPLPPPPWETPIGRTSDIAIEDDPAVTIAIGLFPAVKPLVFEVGAHEAEAFKKT
jgi:hypothetical protein